MELIIGFLNSVVVPILIVVGILGTVAGIIAFVSEAAAKRPRAWRYLAWVAVYWGVVILGSGLANVLYGALLT